MEKIAVKDIMETAAIYADDSKELKQIMDLMEQELAIVRAKYMPQIEHLSKTAAEAKNLTLQLLTANPQFFDKPRSKKSNGVEVGYRKSSDSLEIVNEELTINLIREYLPELYPVLVKQSLSLIKDGLKNLSQDEQRLIKVFMASGMDKPYIKLEDKYLSKLVEAALNMVA